MEERNTEAEKMDEVLLPGFRFHPTDEELVGFYLKRKIQQRPLSIELIKQLDIYKYDPWDLPKLATTGEKEWYFYCPRDRKYRNSARPNRVTGAGFWKATGTDRPIYSSEGNKCIGLKKSLVFYKGKAAKGIKTDWMMHEFRLPSLTDHSLPQSKRFLDKTIPANDSWAICRIFKKNNSTAHRALSHSWVSPLPTTETNTTKPTDLNPKDSYTFNNNNITQSNISSEKISSSSSSSLLAAANNYKTTSSLYFNYYNNILNNDHNPSTTSSTTTTTFSPFDFVPFKPIITNQMFMNNKTPQLPHFTGEIPANLLFSPFDVTTTTTAATNTPSLANKYSTGSIDVSSMLLNMSSSIMLNGDHHHQCIDFSGSQQNPDSNQCNGFSSRLPIHETMQMNNSRIDHEDEINILMKNQNVMQHHYNQSHDVDDDHHHDHDQWTSVVRSINGSPFSLPLMGVNEAWNKTSPMSMWDSSSCPSDQMSTSTIPTNKCYT